MQKFIAAGTIEMGVAKRMAQLAIDEIVRRQVNLKTAVSR
jgi:hypothetical protein